MGWRWSRPAAKGLIAGFLAGSAVPAVADNGGTPPVPPSAVVTPESKAPAAAPAPTQANPNGLSPMPAAPSGAAPSVTGPSVTSPVPALKPGASPPAPPAAAAAPPPSGAAPSVTGPSVTSPVPALKPGASPSVPPPAPAPPPSGAAPSVTGPSVTSPVPALKPDTPPSAGGAKPPAATSKPPSADVDKPSGDASSAKVLTLAARPAVSVGGEGTWDDGFKTIMGAVQGLQDALAKDNVKPTGHPLAVFRETDNNGFKFEAMVPVDAAADLKAALPAGAGFAQTPAGKVLKFQHRDAYDAIDSTYEAITAYLDEKGYDTKNLFIEEYLNTVKGSEDPSLQVDIYVFVK